MSTQGCRCIINEVGVEADLYSHLSTPAAAGGDVGRIGADGGTFKVVVGDGAGAVAVSGVG